MLVGCFWSSWGRRCSQATTWGIGAVTGSALWWQRFRSSPTLLPAAVQKGFDVFNALDLMENKTFLEKLKFGIGDGNLQYYLYNWKCPSMGAEKVCARGAGSSDWQKTGHGHGASVSHLAQMLGGWQGHQPQSSTEAGGVLSVLPPFLSWALGATSASQ